MPYPVKPCISFICSSVLYGEGLELGMNVLLGGRKLFFTTIACNLATRLSNFPLSIGVYM